MWEGITPTPDPGFMRKLKTFDPNLDCEFNREVERFIITQPSRLRSGRLVAAIIENPGSDHYRQPDNRDLRNLAKFDFERKDHKRRILEGEDRIIQAQQDSQRKAREEIHERALDNKYWLRRKLKEAAGEVSDGYHVRRITPKARGYVVKDKRLVKT